MCRGRVGALPSLHAGDGDIRVAAVFVGSGTARGSGEAVMRLVW